MSVVGFPVRVMAGGQVGASGQAIRSLGKLILAPVAEPKTVKNRMHVDVRLRGEAHLEQLLRLGATVVSEHAGWRVLADPEGNEFYAMHPD